MSTPTRFPSIRNALLAVGLGLVLASSNSHAAAKLGLRFAGEYTAGLKYAKGDAVTWKGTLYQAVKGAQRGKLPNENPDIWRVVLPGYVGTGGSNDCGSPGPGNNLAGCRFEELNGAGSNPLKDKNLRGANLTGATLIGDLGDVDLTGAKLVRTSFGEVAQGSVLHPASLGSGSFLEFADLSGLFSNGSAPLSAPGVNFGGARIVGANLQSANLQNANLSSTVLDGTSFGGTDLSAAQLNNASVKGTSFYFANLSDAQLNGVDLSTVENAVLDNVNLTRAQMGGANLRKLLLTNLNLTGAYLGFANLSGAQKGENVTLGADPDSGDTNFEFAICPDDTFVDGQLVTTCVGHGF